MLIIDLHQEEAVGRGGGAGLGAVFAVEDRFDLFRGELSPAGLDKRPDYAADHFIEKAVAFDGYRDDAAFAADRDPGYRFDRGIMQLVIVIGSECVEIVFANEAFSGSAHFADV